MKKLTIEKPSDFHVHLRDDAMLARTVPDCCAQFSSAIVMPNLKNPITTVDQAKAYKNRIETHIPVGKKFTPLMTLFLTENTSAETVVAAKKSGFIHGIKLYPAHVTTNSSQGIDHIQKIDPVLATMEEQDLPLLIHGETSDAHCDIFEREKIFIDETLSRWVKRFPKLRIVLEHISTQHAVDFISAAPKNVAATITAHHLLLNRNDLLSGGIRPHHYCLPILKTESDRQSLIKAATSGNPKFFLGTDSAPHTRSSKESACGCAGIYTAPAAIALYASVFEEAQALDKLRNFACVFGAEFYGLSVNTDTITLVKESWKVPDQLSFGSEVVVPFRAGETLSWKVVE